MYTDLLIQLKNAQSVKKESLKLPYTAMDASVLEILERHRFIKSFERKGRAPKKYFDVVLRYKADGTGAISGIRFISKPSRRLYLGYRDIRPVRQGFGVGVVSTSSGVMTTAQAKKSLLGGQFLFTIW